MPRWRQIAVITVALCMGGTAHALIINGKEIDDLWEYVHQVLADDQAAWEARQEQARLNPSFELARHYDYTALRLLSETELVRAAIQGSFAARREFEGADPQVIALNEEANINFVLEYFPLLVRDTSSSDPLFTVLEGGSGLGAGQHFLLKRAVPGMANQSTFTDYWQEEVLRRNADFNRIVKYLCESTSVDGSVRALALEIYYAHRLRSLDDFVQRDPNVRAHIAAGGGQVSAEELVVRDDLTLADYNQEPFEERLKSFVEVAEVMGNVADPKNRAPDVARNTARALLEKLYQEVPLSPEDQANVKKILDGK